MPENKVQNEKSNHSNLTSELSGQYKVSVVCPIHNSEQYLEECIESVINQTIGFESNIQLILIDDESDDSSLEIARGYQTKYPNNIVLIEFAENRGIAASRNAGIELATGEYLCFLDSDDKWDLTAFENLTSFLDNNKAEIDCACTNVERFGALSKIEYEEEEYAETGIINVRDNPRLLRRHLNCSMFHRVAIDGLRFDNSESGDSELIFLTRAILRKCTFGHITDTFYYYRKRIDNTNAEQGLRNFETYYSSVDSALVNIAKETANLHGEVIPYVQELLLYCVQRRIKQKKVPERHEHLIPDYLRRLGIVLQYIDDGIILRKRGMAIEYKAFTLKLKHGEDVNDLISCRRGMIRFDNHALYNINKKSFLNIVCLEISDGTLILEGRAGLPSEFGEYRILIRDNNGNEYYCDNYSDFDSEVISINQTILKRKGFRLKIPCDSINKLIAYVDYREKRYKTKIRYGEWAKLSGMLEKSYYHNEGVCIKRNELGTGILISHTEDSSQFEQELRDELSSIGRQDISEIREGVFLRRKKKKKPIWLFVDRVNSANENAAFLFQYVRKKHKREVDAYYLISKDSDDYRKIRRLGHVVPYYSDKARDLFLAADKYIVSQTSDFVLIPSVVEIEYFKDMIPPVYAYMQHGVLEKDISKTQNKLVTNFNLFVTSAYPENEYMFKYPYGYEEDEVLLSGLARHDLILEYADRHGNELIIAPTWRHNISARMDREKGGRGYNHEFIHSEFYRFYNSLINDDRILNELREKGFKGVLRLHPYMREQERDFIINNMFEIADGSESYEKQFETCALLVTDYSSIASDYAYAAKPVIYAQFDKDTFYEGHSYEEGFFDYERDGFGPVCYDYESTVAEIIKALRNDCKMEEEYLERRKAFFAHFDGMNRERIYQAIKAK